MKIVIKKQILLLLLIVMASYGFSQNGYPRWIVYESDTVVAITEAQLDKVNIVKVERDACYNAMWEGSMTIDSLEDNIAKYKNAIQLQRELANERDSLINEMNSDIKNTRKKNKLWKAIAGSSVVVNVVLILLLL